MNTLFDDLPDQPAHLGVVFFRWRVFSLLNSRNQIGGKSSGERLFAGDRFVEHHTHRVDVGPQIDIAGVLELLGCHVGGRSEGHPLAGQPALRILRRSRNPEIHQFNLAPLGEQDVGRLDVAVDHPAVVGVFEGQAGLIQNVQCHLVRQVPFAADQLLQRQAVDVFQYDKMAAPLFEVVIHVDDIVVAKIHKQTRLPPEALYKVGVPPQGQFFEDDRPLESGVDALVHRTHPSLGDQFQYFVLSDTVGSFSHVNPLYLASFPPLSVPPPHRKALLRYPAADPV